MNCRNNFFVARGNIFGLKKCLFFYSLDDNKYDQYMHTKKDKKKSKTENKYC